jgi:hypothetical protein
MFQDRESAFGVVEATYTSRGHQPQTLAIVPQDCGNWKHDSVTKKNLDIYDSVRVGQSEE